MEGSVLAVYYTVKNLPRLVDLSVERGATMLKHRREQGKKGQPSLIIYYCTYLPVIAIRITAVSVLSIISSMIQRKEKTKKNVNKSRFVYYCTDIPLLSTL